MTTYSRCKTILLLAVMATFIVPAHARAGEYKWLKAKNYKNIFVYTNFKGSDVVANQLTEIIKRILFRYGIKPTISKSLIFQPGNEKGKSMDEFSIPELIKNEKIFLYIFGKCIKYGSGYMYQFDIHFAVFDKKYFHALLHSSPQYGVMGAENIIGIKIAFRELIEDAVADYLSANK